MKTRTVRSPENAGSGRFYPADPVELQNMLNKLVPEPPVDVDGHVVGLVAPHAGYPFSGPTAGKVFSTLSAARYERAVVIGPSHYCRFPGASVFDGDAYATPLGEVPVDTAFTNHLMESLHGFHFYPPCEDREHSVEVEVPFLQHVLGDFSVVAIQMSDQSYENAARVALALREALAAYPSPTVFVASSDLYHGPNRHFARAQSHAAADAAAALDPEAFSDGISEGRFQACGPGPIMAVTMVARALGANHGALVDVTTSYDAYPVRDDYVVGYMGLAMARRQPLE